MEFSHEYILDSFKKDINCFSRKKNKQKKKPQTLKRYLTSGYRLVLILCNCFKFFLIQPNLIACVILKINFEKCQQQLLMTYTKRDRVQGSFTQITYWTYKPGFT